ncbi:MAG: polyphosphate polymerase domain-containing protein [Planctomycetes bacterium]|nr:polyphosphate polymerase domain-containing protein [Planctomycetota bacterium]
MTTDSSRSWRAQRRELKYLVDETLARRIRAGALPFVEPDPFAARCPGFVYPVASLYLDGSDLPLYRETIEGLRARFKLRVRSYSDDPDGRWFFEIKRRQDGLVEKTRAALPRGQAQRLLELAAADDLPEDPVRRRAVEQFVTLAEQTAARPRTIVRYDREAYVGRFDDEVRVTFDRMLRAAVTDEPVVTTERADFVPVESRRVVVEMKFNHRMPNWMDTLIHRFELRRQSFSKYGRSIEALVAQGATRHA